jgi:hypothetical protein
VHAAGDGSKPRDELRPAADISTERIDEANRHIGVRVQDGRTDFSTAHRHVVNQQAHPDAAIRRLDKLVKQEGAGHVVVKEIILGIDAAFGRQGQDRPGDERIDAAVEEIKTGGRGSIASQRIGEGCQAGVLGVGQGIRNRFAGIVRQGGTAPCREQQYQYQQSLQAW